MVVPWTGFAMCDFIDWCRPSSAAKYVRFISTYHPERMPGIAEQPWHRWPYAEALTIAEATNELTFLASGTYGRELRPDQGAPLRLVVPWKYGHKSIKSIARIEFTAQRPATFWNSALPHEYPIDANVDPRVPHPRWSQQYESMIGTGERTKTQLYNGYGQFVAGLYR
jgi:sulfoxide reductase catalytic subunit YedY